MYRASRGLYATPPQPPITHQPHHHHPRRCRHASVRPPAGPIPPYNTAPRSTARRNTNYPQWYPFEGVYGCGSQIASLGANAAFRFELTMMNSP